jgi:hypothetical protein
MRRGIWLAFGATALVGGCSWIPFFGSNDEHLTNAAVEACQSKAEDLGYDGAGERESVPLGDGRYSVVLDVRQNQGFGQVTCSYDPKKGADLPPPPKPSEKPEEKPAPPSSEPNPAATPAPAGGVGPQPAK